MQRKSFAKISFIHCLSLHLSAQDFLSSHFSTPTISACFAFSFLVGYAQSGLKFGATMSTPQFISVDGSAMDLQSLIPTGDGVSDCVVIQTLDAYGRTVDSYKLE